MLKFTQYFVVQAIVVVLLLSSCSKQDDIVVVESLPYSFFVAGHVYGAPGVDNAGFHPPFVDKFSYITSTSNMAFGVLTGDIVKPSPVEQDWIEVDSAIQVLGLPVYFAVGNHDMENRELYESRYGRTYYSYNYQNDLFIVLDPNIDGWNISGEQLEFLKNTLIHNAPEARNIFVFFHQLLWYKIGNIYDHVLPNSFAGISENEINFWSEVEPLFSSLSNEVIMFAGDVGAGSWSSDFMYHNYGNITLIATGMGEGVGDNIVLVSIDKEGTIAYELVAIIGSDIHALGKLEDYILP